MAKALYFGTTLVKKGVVKQGKTRGPLAGARATVESAGELNARVTATRILAIGVFALAAKKKTDDRSVLLTIEGDGYGIIEDVKPKKEKDARRFAAEFNVMAAEAARKQGETSVTVETSPPPPPQTPPPPTAPAGWIADPTGRHELRYWDGAQWTEHVSDAGSPMIDTGPA